MTDEIRHYRIEGYRVEGGQEDVFLYTDAPKGQTVLDMLRFARWLEPGVCFDRIITLRRAVPEAHLMRLLSLDEIVELKLVTADEIAEIGKRAGRIKHTPEELREARANSAAREEREAKRDRRAAIRSGR
jgi:hypothetical protein